MLINALAELMHKCVSIIVVSPHFIDLFTLLTSADILCKQFGPRSGPTNYLAELNPNCLTLMIFIIEKTFEKVNY